VRTGDGGQALREAFHCIFSCHFDAAIAWPLELKEIPNADRVLIITASIKGGLTGRSDRQDTMKLAPDPPTLSDSFTT